jgi:hypothetical protein
VSRTSSRSKAASTGARGKSADQAKQATGAAGNAVGNGAGELLGVPDAVSNVGIPVVTAALGIAGGVLLGRTALKRNRKVMGIPIPNTKIDLAGISKQVGEAGRQFGNLAREVRMVREKAEKLGKAIG